MTLKGVGSEPLPPERRDAADINNDDIIDIGDIVSLILQGN